MKSTSKDLSLYIHIPFCKSRCLYCGFLTFAGKSGWVPDYVESLCVEIEKRSRNFKDYEFETIYFGGGTPSFIDPLLIKKIIQQVVAYYKVKHGSEVTIECNPESITEEKLKIYKEAGINRFSLGIQSFNKETLRRIARPHDSETIFKALSYFKNADIKDFGADFIMGLPVQTLASFKKEVDTILSFNPTHLSYYFLSHDTPKIDLFIKECPDEDEQIRMYNWLCAKLKKSGFEHYEVSNWALPGFECKHNLRYWEQKDYLGVGLGAHSIVNGEMWENQKDLDGYLRDPMKTENHMKIDADLKRMEYIMLSLRTNKGIDIGVYEKLGNFDELIKNAATYIKSGHLKKTAGRLVATEKGFLILETITRALI